MVTRSRRNRGVLAHAGLSLAFVLMFHFATAAYGQSVKLAWDASPDSSVAGYRIYRSEQSGTFAGSPINGSVLLTTAYTDSTVQYGHTYYYVVAAVSTSGVQSTYSNQVQAAISSLTTNAAPTVSAGPNQTITLPSAATLTATATDDGLPNGTLTYHWTVISGTGVTLSSPDSPTTTASFTAAGAYTLRVTASDGQLSASADVTVNVSVDALNLLVSKNGNVIKGAMTSISESSADQRVKKLGLYIDDQLAATVQGSTLSYRWDLRRQSGSHVITGMSFDSTDSVLASKSITVTVK